MKAFLSSWKSYAFSMTSIYSYSSWKARLFTHTTKERSKNKSGTGRQGGGGGRVRESERKEKEEVEVWEHLSSTLGLFIWGAGLGCQMWHHTQTNTLDRRVRKVSDKSRDCFSLSIKKVSDRWRRSLFVIVCVCATCIAVTADSPLKTQQQELTEMTALILPCCTKWQQINMIQSDLNRKT